MKTKKLLATTVAILLCIGSIPIFFNTDDVVSGDSALVLDEEDVWNEAIEIDYNLFDKFIFKFLESEGIEFNGDIDLTDGDGNFQFDDDLKAVLDQYLYDTVKEAVDGVKKMFDVKSAELGYYEGGKDPKTELMMNLFDISLEVSEEKEDGYVLKYAVDLDLEVLTGIILKGKFLKEDKYNAATIGWYYIAGFPLKERTVYANLDLSVNATINGEMDVDKNGAIKGLTMNLHTDVGLRIDTNLDFITVSELLGATDDFLELLKTVFSSIDWKYSARTYNASASLDVNMEAEFGEDGLNLIPFYLNDGYAKSFVTTVTSLTGDANGNLVLDEGTKAIIEMFSDKETLDSIMNFTYYLDEEKTKGIRFLENGKLEINNMEEFLVKNGMSTEELLEIIGIIDNEVSVTGDDTEGYDIANSIFGKSPFVTGFLWNAPVVVFDYGYEGIDPVVVFAKDGKIPMHKVPSDPREGYNFVKWSGAEYDNEGNLIAEKGMVFTAEWEGKPVTVTYDHADAEIEDIVESTKVGENHILAYPTKAPYGKFFEIWLLDGVEYNGDSIAITPEMVDDGLEFVAKWNDYPTVTFDFDHGDLDPVTKISFEGAIKKEDIPLADGRDGYTFVKWVDTADATNTYDGTEDIPATKNMRLKAQWVGNKIGITYDGNGSSDPESKETKVGDEFIIDDAPVAPAGMHFVAWLLDGTDEEFDAGDPILMTPEMEADGLRFVAIWAGNSVNVAYNCNGSGEDIDAHIATVGDKLVLPAAPTAPDGKTFKSWLIGVTEYSAGQSIDITPEMEDGLMFVAQWSDVPAKAEVIDDPGTTPSMTGDDDDGDDTILYIGVGIGVATAIGVAILFLRTRP